MGACYAVIEESNVGIVENLGQFNRLLQPGCHVLNCITEKVKSQASLSLKTMNIKIETVTKDQLSVTILIGIQYMINVDNIMPPSSYNTSSSSLPRTLNKSEVPLDDTIYELKQLKYNEKSRLTSDTSTTTVYHGRGSTYQNASILEPSYDAVYKSSYLTHNHVQQISQFVNSYFRSIGRDYTMEELFKSQNVLSNGLNDLLNTEMYKYGYYVHRVLITDIDPPDNVKATMNMVKESENKRDAMLNDAEAKKKAAILHAEGLAKTRELEGIGIAKQRLAMVNGLKDSVSNMCGQEVQMDSEQLTEIILKMQQIEMLNTAAQTGKNTFIVYCNTPSNGMNSVKSTEEQVRDAILSTKEQL